MEGNEQADAINNASQAQYMNPLAQYGDSSIVLLTNPSDEVFQLELSLRSLRFANGKLTPSSKPLMNEEGISSIIGIVQSVVSRDTIMSDIEKNHIPVLMEHLTDTIIIDLTMNKKRYAIDSIANKNKILQIACYNAYFCLNRAKDGGERRFWKGSQQDITTSIKSGNEQGGGLFSNVMSFLKKK